MVLIFIKFSAKYFLFYLFVFVSILKKYIAFDHLLYQQSITLLNGNIFIIHKNGITIYDSSLSSNIFVIELIDDDTKYSKITISRFSENDYGYIISTINDIIYIFDYEEKILNKYPRDTIGILSGHSYTIVPIKRKEQKFIFMIGFIDDDNNNNKNTILNFFEYDKINNISNLILKEGFILEAKVSYLLDCQLMLNSTENDEIIECFTVLYYKLKIIAFYINPISYKRINSTEEASFIYSINSQYVYSIKTAISLNKQKSLVCFFLCLDYIVHFFCI